MQKPPLNVNNRGGRFNNQMSYAGPAGGKHRGRGQSSHYYNVDKPVPAWRRQAPSYPAGYVADSSGYTFGNNKKNKNKKFRKALPSEDFDAYSPMVNKKAFMPYDPMLSSSERDEYFERGVPPSAAGASQVQ